YKKLWNNLPQNIQSARSVAIFKKALSSEDYVVITLFNFGTRALQIIHCRLRHNKSEVKARKFQMFISDNLSF
ncbi:hypothetical protein LOTGIDRAFT_117451, partial [Lottia gigantea]